MMTTTKIPIISLDKVYYRRDSTQILSDINWQIKQGDHWALVGLNGSGKSTIIRILGGYDFPSQGQVQILGEKLGKTSLPKLRQRIGLVSTWISQQLPKHYTVLDTIISGEFASFGIYQDITPAMTTKAQNLIDQFDFNDFTYRKITSLSQGESQMVLILRALMTDPELLILDEPNTGLDLFARERLLEFIQDLSIRKPQLNQLLITHHTEEIIPMFNQTCLLKDGTIFDKGATADMLSVDKLRNFYERPIQILPFIDERIQVVPNDRM